MEDHTSILRTCTYSSSYTCIVFIHLRVPSLIVMVYGMQLLIYNSILQKLDMKAKQQH